LLGRYIAGRVLEKTLKPFDLPTAYSEAIKFFTTRKVVTKAAHRKLSAAARRTAFTSVAANRKWILEELNTSLNKAVIDGASHEDWLKDISKHFDRLGITRLSPPYWRLVFQNASQEAVFYGKEEIWKDADTEEWPLRQQITVEDERVRKPHAKLHGFTAPIKHPIWKRLRNPLDHGCRCSQRLVNKDEGLKASKNIPSLSGPGFGFVAKTF